jgi:hypothetical protein
MKITKQEALSIAKGLTLPPDRMEEIAIFCGKDGGAAMGMGRHGIYFALGDLLRQHLWTADEGAFWPEGDTLDLAPYAGTIDSTTAFAALRKHLPRYDVRPVITLLNTSIITAEGTHSLKKVSLEEACKLVTGAIINSAIGHEATAKIMDTLLGIEVPVNRQAYQSKPGDVALVFKLKGRPPEGKILTVEEMDAIGYEFFVLTHLPTDDLKAKIKALVVHQAANGSADSAALTLATIGDLLST